MHKEREVVAPSQGAYGVEEGHISRIMIVNQKVSDFAISDTSQHNMAGDISQTVPTAAPALSRPPDSLCKGSKQRDFHVGSQS